MGNTSDQTTLWVSKSIEQTLEELKVNAATGLTDQEAETRRYWE